MKTRAGAATRPGTGADGRASSRRGTGTRDAIDKSAIELFAKLGYNATSMRAIAGAADVQPAAIYHWYSSKEAILIQLQNDFMERLTEAVDSAVAVQHTPVRRLAAAVREHVVFHGLHTKAAFVTDSEIRALTSKPRKQLIATRDEYQETFLAMINAGIGDDSLRVSDPRVATYAILLQCTGVALWFDPKGPLDLEDVARLHVELVLASLQASPKLIAKTVKAVTPATTTAAIVDTGQAKGKP